ncbi:MAG: hotdog domain-containing protein [Deferrisomatales bacterium]|nr:hotdog domain-containing protein [Deferrisomatales bacterium]
MKQRTHDRIDPRLVGEVEELGEGTSRVGLRCLPEMAADGTGLVHGGFTFGLADYAAMVAVNDPHVVLGAAEVRFLAPVRVGQRVVAEARVAEVKGKKHVVPVTVRADGVPVLEGTFTAFVLERHVLEG